MAIYRHAVVLGDHVSAACFEFFRDFEARNEYGGHGSLLYGDVSDVQPAGRTPLWRLPW
jgi:hypothetical protein